MINKTDWEPFAEETGVTVDDLNTIEGVVEVAQKYYEWTDEQTRMCRMMERHSTEETLWLTISFWV